MFTMRFDMRAPAIGAQPVELYETALEMVAWAEGKGCMAVQVSEHHRSCDGYLPSPLIMASAIAARTKATPEKCLDVLQAAFRGEEFEYEGRPIRITPAPFSEGGPYMFMGGGSPVVARRAARYGMGFLAMGGHPELQSIYVEACKEAGNPPGLFIDPEPGQPNSAFVARDPDEAWAKWGPHLLHDAMAYAEWMGDDIEAATKSESLTVESLRAEKGNYQIFSPEEAIAEIEARGRIQLQPLCGGLPPEYAWESLGTVVRDVMPNLKTG